MKDTLKLLAPGTVLREGLDSILGARTGALIVVGGEKERVKALMEGGFDLDVPLTPSNLYELSKMDGAIILDSTCQKILYANVQLNPDPFQPSSETGIRHRVAERVARQANTLVISISKRRNLITFYKGAIKYILRDPAVLLVKANQALQTLEKYKAVFNRSLANLSALEMENVVTLREAVEVLQRSMMVTQVAEVIDTYIAELGKEGNLIRMQLTELMQNVEENILFLIRDYARETFNDWVEINKIKERLEEMGPADILELTNFTRVLGYGSSAQVLENHVLARGYRLLNEIPRLPLSVIENAVNFFHNLQHIIKATSEELVKVEGIGEARARSIIEGLRRLREEVFLKRHL